ncbi:hypothetical protein [Aestuariispira insulae]|uniref:Uncharacterized protein n=1 Tax=Aestuariispira insulae TaxID=1461337 RepID=A0A3D9HM45_9PROT|nr:hypothetical protein [Aestuariispira insulae]RED49976.1 hypothetical protein DFP90_105349 [Aestuariispira insulae]
MNDSVRALTAWAAVALVMVAIIGLGVGMKEDIRKGVFVLHKLYIRNVDKPVEEKRTVMETCRAAETPNHRWRWYAKTYPSPTIKWQLFEVSGLICHGNRKSWKGYPVDDTQMKYYGCFMSEVGLFCRPDADPNRHPNAEEVL